MKPGACLVTGARRTGGRGGALRGAGVRRLRGAALDAFASELPGADNPLSLPTVIATPHGGRIPTGRRRRWGAWRWRIVWRCCGRGAGLPSGIRAECNVL
ncbi:MAG: hypothetical protein H6663_10205 [Candidatus Promineofilum sp.]|nr:hypothetical protein [Promineifilum sp.]